jgi:hypothetical protein
MRRVQIGVGRGSGLKSGRVSLTPDRVYRKFLYLRLTQKLDLCDSQSHGLLADGRIADFLYLHHSSLLIDPRD